MTAKRISICRKSFKPVYRRKRKSRKIYKFFQCDSRRLRKLVSKGYEIVNHYRAVA